MSCFLLLGEQERLGVAAALLLTVEDVPGTAVAQDDRLLDRLRCGVRGDRRSSSVDVVVAVDARRAILDDLTADEEVDDLRAVVRLRPRR